MRNRSQLFAYTSFSLGKLACVGVALCPHFFRSCSRAEVLGSISMELFSVIVRFFQGGGEFMYPIAVVLVVGLAIADRALHLSCLARRFA